MDATVYPALPTLPPDLVGGPTGTDGRFRALFSELRVGVLVYGPNAEILVGNAAACDLLGVSPDQLLGRTVYDSHWNVIHEDGRPFTSDTYPVPRALATGRPVRNVLMGVYRPPYRDRVWLLVDADPDLAADGSIAQVICTLTDMTERKAAQDALRRSRQEYQALVENAPDVIARLDRNLRYLYVNPAIERETGIPPLAIIGKTSEEAGLTPPAAAAWRRCLAEVFASGQEQSFEFCYESPAGLRHYLTRVVPELDAVGSVEAVLTISRDITERRHAEDRFRKAFHASPEALAIVQLTDGRVVDVNESFVRLMGYTREELLEQPGTTHLLWPDPATRSCLAGLLRESGSVRDWDFPFRRKSGEMRRGLLALETIDVEGTPCVLAICRDMTDREALDAVREREHQLYLATVRSLAATVDARDAYTHSHSQQVAFYCRLIAEQLGLPAAATETIELAGLLHDIGKIAIPDTILQKPGRLTAEEMAIMRTHAARGAAIVGSAQSQALAPIVPMIRHHHERWDGAGYPDGLAGSAIPLGAAVIAVADAFDTMTTARPYKRAKTVDEACTELRRARGSQFHPDVTEALLGVIARDQAGGVGYLEAIARGSEPETSARPRLTLTTGILSDPPGPQSVSYQEQQRLAAHRHALYEVSRGFDAVAGEDEIAAVAAQLAHDYCGAESLYLAEWQDAGGGAIPPGLGQMAFPAQLAARWGWQVSGPFVPFSVRLYGPPSTWSALLAGPQAVALPDVAATGAPVQALLAAPGWRSGLVVPLRAGGEILGTLGLGYQSLPRAFSADDLELADALGAAVARALAGGRLQRTAARLRQQIEAMELRNRTLARYSSELTVLNATARILGEQTDCATLCRRVVDVLASTFGYTLVSVALLEGNVLYFHAGTGYEHLPEGPWPLSAGISGRVVRTGRPALVLDVGADPDYVPLKAGIRSEVCVPLTGRSGVLGVVNVESSAPDPLGPPDLQLLQTLAPQIVIALENARLAGQLLPS